MRAAAAWWWCGAVVLVAAVAAVLRLVALDQVPRTPFYDAAVRSMSLSLHNFLYGAFDPGATASIDKPPADLWLQVLSVKVFGFSGLGLRFPNALAAFVAVILLYDLVRRIAGRPAGLASALALAVLPISVLTSRSDTMDSLMMGLLVAAAWLLMRAAQTGRMRWLLGAAFVLGLDFNVKLFEALIAVPALLVFAWMSGAAGPLGRGSGVRVRRLALAAGVFTATALSWIIPVSLTPASDRPFPIGSSDGTVWNAVFVYNGWDRLKPASTHRVHPTSARTPPVRPSVPREPSRLTQPGPLRLFGSEGFDYGLLVGVELLAALGLGGVALLLTRLRGSRLLGRSPPDAASARTPAIGRVPPATGAERELRRAGVAGLVVWLATGLILFSLQSRLAPRYLEAFTPAVAIALGVGLVVVVRRASQPLGVGALAVVLIVVIAQGVAVTGAQASATDPSTALESAVAIVLLAVTLLVAALRVRTYVFALRGAHAGAPRARPNIVAPVGTGGPAARRGAWLLGLLTMSALLALPVAADVHLIDNHSGDQAITPRFHTGLVGRIDRYLDRHDRVRRYELAASAPTVAAPFIVADHRPLLLLTTYNGRPLTTLAQLQQSVARGEVRYLVTRGACPNLSHPELPACAAAVRWAMAHGRDVTGQVSRGHRGELYQLG